VSGRATGLLAIALVAAGLHGCGRPAPEPWRAVEVPTDAVFSGMWFTDSLNGWITGGGWAIDGGLVGRTRDGGRTWTFQSGVMHGYGTDFGIGEVFFRDTLHGCAVARGGIVLVTEDGGASWREARHASIRLGALYDLHFLDERNGWAAGTGVTRTEDGGETWRTLVRSEAENGYFGGNAIHFVDASRGWLAGQGGSLNRTNDGGMTWTSVTLPLPAGERPTFRDLTFVDPAHGWLVGERGFIFHTADGGATWTRQENGVPVVRAIPKGERRVREPFPELETEPDRLALFAVRFADAGRGWAAGYYADVAESVVLGTRDGGATWTIERVQKGELLRTLHAVDTLNAWTTGDRARTVPQVVLRHAGSAR
jgi:photosystem II stability/assembly factor-like uncharacterized protein